jgi:hypothetical protein
MRVVVSHGTPWLEDQEKFARKQRTTQPAAYVPVIPYLKESYLCGRHEGKEQGSIAGVEPRP